jgi:hypothetical protein
VIALLAGACSFKSDFGGTSYQCGEGERCPDGYMCVDGVCAMGSSSDGGIDATPGPDAMPTGLRCGTLSLLQDDFGNGVIDPRWNTFEDPGSILSESGGATRVALSAGAGDPYAGIGSDAFYDLRDGAFDVSVAQIGGRDTILEIRDWEGQKAQLVVEDGELLVAMFNTPNDGIRFSVPYDATDHRYWRVSADATTMTWAVSANRTTWVDLHSETTSLDLAHVQGIVSAGTQLATASTAIFEDVNPSPSTMGFCPAADLADDFAGTSFEPFWQHWGDTGCSAQRVGGALQMTFDGVLDNCFAGVQTYHLFDLRESSFVIDAAGVPSAAGFVEYMQILVPGDDSNHLEIGHDGTTIYFEQQINRLNVAEDSAPYSPTNDRWWRTRGAGGRLYLDTSPDGVNWNNRLDAAAGFDVSAILLILGAGNYEVGPPVTVTWDNLNP